MLLLKEKEPTALTDGMEFLLGKINMNISIFESEH